jgi:hypothetical protein
VHGFIFTGFIFLKKIRIVFLLLAEKVAILMSVGSLNGYFSISLVGETSFFLFGAIYF